MSRVEFMRRLAELLIDLPVEERSEALQFYNGYFYDAGPEHEAEILRELGSPEAVSEMIHREVLGENWQQASRQPEPDPGRVEYAFEQAQDGRPGRDAETYRAPDYRAYRQQRQMGQDAYSQERAAYDDHDGMGTDKRKNPWKIVAIIAVCVIFFPVIVGVLGGVFGLIVGAIGLVFGLVAGAIGGAIGLLVGGVAGLVASVLKLAMAPIGALLSGGLSLLAIGLGLISFWLVWLMCSRMLPWLWRGVKRFWNTVFHRRTGEGQMR